MNHLTRFQQPESVRTPPDGRQVIGRVFIANAQVVDPHHHPSRRQLEITLTSSSLGLQVRRSHRPVAWNRHRRAADQPAVVNSLKETRSSLTAKATSAKGLGPADTPTPVLGSAILNTDSANRPRMKLRKIWSRTQRRRVVSAPTRTHVTVVFLKPSARNRFKTSSSCRCLDSKTELSKKPASSRSPRATFATHELRTTQARLTSGL